MCLLVEVSGLLQPTHKGGHRPKDPTFLLLEEMFWLALALLALFHVFDSLWQRLKKGQAEKKRRSSLAGRFIINLCGGTW